MEEVATDYINLCYLVIHKSRIPPLGYNKKDQWMLKFDQYIYKFINNED
jgi:hypothetical protein